MMHKIFMIYDDKAKAYLPPFFLPEMGQAIRSFSDCVNDPGHAFGRHPGDYTLFCAGSWDVTSGRFSIESSFVCCANGVELVKRIEANAEIARVNGDVKPIFYTKSEV